MNIIDINSIELSELDVYSSLSEPQLRHYRDPEGGVFIAESCKVIGRALTGGMKPESVLVDERVFDKDEVAEVLSRVGDVPVYRAPSDVMESITGYHLTGGILCCMTRPELPSAASVLPGADGSRSRIAVIENVVNPTNVGAVFRSAAAFNIDAVLLTEGTCDPLERRAMRVSMGTVFQLPWTFIGKDDVCGTLRSLGYKSAAMCLASDSITLESSVLKDEPRLAVLIGNEGNGLTDETCANADYKVIIPMSHEVDSLNAAAASAVAFWELAGKK
jgi:tRNA G18 (ribose-2'-O)-methylase SpoU